MKKESYGVEVFVTALALIFVFAVYKIITYQSDLIDARAQAERLEEEQQHKQEVARLRREKEQEVERLRRTELLDNLSTASEEEVRQIFRSCKAAVRGYMNRRNNGPFQPFLVDEYSADTYQALAYFSDASIESEDTRVSNFLNARGSGNEVALDHYVNLSYAVIHTEDSFSGPTKEVRSYRCAMASDMAIDRVF